MNDDTDQSVLLEEQKEKAEKEHREETALIKKKVNQAASKPGNIDNVFQSDRSLSILTAKKKISKSPNPKGGEAVFL